jgi:hypothetical protein
MRLRVGRERCVEILFDLFPLFCNGMKTSLGLRDKGWRFGPITAALWARQP